MILHNFSILLFPFIFFGVYSFAQQDDFSVARGNFGGRLNPKLRAIQQASSSFRRRGDRLVVARHVGKDEGGGSEGGGIFGNMGRYLSKLLYGQDGNENGHESISAKLGLGAGDREGARGFRSEVRRIDDDSVVESKSLRMDTDGSYEFQFRSPDGTERQEVGRESGDGGSVKSGGWSYVGADGNRYELRYKADENGFRPIGAHLPQSGANTTPKPRWSFPRVDIFHKAVQTQRGVDRLAKERLRTQSERSQMQEDLLTKISDLGELADGAVVVTPVGIVGIANRGRKQKSEIGEEEQDNAGIMQVNVNVGTDTTTVPTLDADDEAAYLMFLADIEDLPENEGSLNDALSPETTTTNTDTVEDDEVYDYAEFDDHSGLSSADHINPEVTTLGTVEKEETEATSDAASTLLDGDDETSFLTFLAVPDIKEPRGPKEVEEDFLEDFEKFPSKKQKEKVEQIHGEDMALMDFAGTDVPIADTTPLSEVEVEVTTETAAATLEPNDEEMFLRFLEDFENIPKKVMHDEDMAIMDLASTDIPSPETTTSHTIVLEEIEATTEAAAPSLDHDDESAFLSFLEDQENLPTKEEEGSEDENNGLSTVPTDSVDSPEYIDEREEDVFGVDILGDTPVEREGSRGQERSNSAKEPDDSETEDHDSGEYPEMITDYFDLSDEDQPEEFNGRQGEAKDEEEKLADLKPNVTDDSVDDRKDDSKDRPDRGIAFNELLRDLARGLEAQLDNAVGTGILTPDMVVNTKRNNKQIDTAESSTVAANVPNSIEYEDFFVDTEEEEEEEEDGFPAFENFLKKKSKDEVEIDESALQSASTPEDSEEDSETKREVKQKVVKNDPNANKKNRDEEEHDEHQVTAPTLDDLEKDPKDDDESKLNLELVREVVQDAQKTVQKVLQVVQDQLEDPKSSETTLKRIQVEDSLAPSLDHDDEAAFLAFLEDFENPPEKEREDELSTVPSDSIEIQEVKEESEDEDNVESATVPHERNPNNSAKDDQPKNADLIRPVGGESRISAGKKRIINEFRSEGQIREPGNLLTVSEMKYTVSITDVEGAKVEVLTTGSGSRNLGNAVEYIGAGNGDFNIVRGGARSGGLVKLDRDFGDYEADHESREDVLGGVKQKKGRRVNGRRGRRHRRGRRMKKGKNQNQRGGRKKTERRRKNDTRSREYLDRRTLRRLERPLAKWAREQNASSVRVRVTPVIDPGY